MCGINGFLSKPINKDQFINIKTMNNCIVHRGPDNEGEFHVARSNYSLEMGMRRLSIIDLDNGNQPIFSEDGTKVIVFNGEIYNYKVLKDDLIKQGCIFTTSSDTEIILKLYEKEGINSFSKLDGMYTFSIYDSKLDKVFIARDFFGEKPLYFFHNESNFIWASELKSIIKTLNYKPEIDKTALNLFFELTYIPAPFTIYKNILKLEPNNYIELNCETNTYVINKIDIPIKKYSISSKKDTIIQTHDLVFKSVLSRSISDVPIGTFLSGGVDSSIVSMCLSKQQSSKIDTFSLGFNKKSFDESDKSRLVSKLINSNHHEFIVSENDLTDNIDHIILNFDEPFADSSALVSFLISKNTKDYVKVALTGDGGDEVFGGYNKYLIGKINKFYTSIINQKIHIKSINYFKKILYTKEDNRGIRFKLNRILSAINYNNDFYFNIISLGYNNNESNLLIKSDYISKDALSFYKDKLNYKFNNLTEFRMVDKLISLEGDMLTKVDRTSMLCSLECRAPFLNKDIWDFTNQIPENFLINGFEKKYILKEAFKEYFPKGFLHKSKMGFGVPVGDWLRSNLKSELISYINKDFIYKQNIFHFEYISNIVNNHLEGKIDNTFKVWTFYCFQKWYKFNYEK